MKKIMSILVVGFFFWSCSTVPISGRKRMNMVSDEEVLPASFAQYEGFIKENKLSSDAEMTAEVREVGKNISRAVDQFMRANGMQKEADGYRWEFNLIEDETVNAWCMPGGKVVFYTGILPICDNTDGIAGVMGHEVAHAFAKHGQERMTNQMLKQAGGTAVLLGTSNIDPRARDTWYTVFGIGSQLGILAYSRTHETEADRLGMVFMIMAGYEPSEAINVWVRMSERAGGQAPPEFLSTHPSNETRINNLREYLPEAKRLAAKFSEAQTGSK